MSKEIYIEKKAESAEVTDYQKLQEAALEMIQQLSGNIWTDYNDHDPGVTIMDAFNYALTELHYKSSFPLENYLTNKEEAFNPNNFGLFLPEQVYPTAPVTMADYRKLFFDSMNNISDLWLRQSPDQLPGTIDIIVDLSPSSPPDVQTKIENKIRKLYHENRNLGEKPGTIFFREKEPLELIGEIHLQDDVNTSEMLALIYFTGACYFNSGIKYHNLHKQLLKAENDWSVLLDGPLLTNGIIDDDSVMPINRHYSISELHDLIKEIKGVKAVEKISLGNGNQLLEEEIICSDILSSYTIALPARKTDIQLLLLKSNKEVDFNYQEVRKHFKKLVITKYGKQNQFADLGKMQHYPQGKYIDFSVYNSIQNDFPDFYGINERGIPSRFADARKAQAKQLKGYLLLFDFITAGSMQEINQLRDLLKVDAQLPVETLPDLSSTVAHYSELVDPERKDAPLDGSRAFKGEVRSRLFDLLDTLYGEDSYLRFLNDFNVYNSTPNQQLQQRALFIQNEHLFIPIRAQGINLLNNLPGNVPGIKQWFAALLGLPNAIEMPVTNIFSEYSLRLLSDNEFYNDIKGLLNIDFVVDKLESNFDQENIFDVPVTEVENPKDNYPDFRTKIYLLYHNIIFESLLRNGIFIDNYKILQPVDNDFILVYHANNKEEWLSLGRFRKHDEAIKVANQLRIFLIDLNLQSENIYLVEHLLLNTNDNGQCYTMHIDNADGEMLFTLLSPVSRSEIDHLKAIMQDTLNDLAQFEIQETKQHDFMVLYETETQNAIYAPNRFASREEAILFLEEIQQQQFLIKQYYVLKEDELLPLHFMDFTITAVLPGWSARFYNKQFRAWCEELLEERRPAHLKINFLWMEASAIRQFEKLYFAWRTALVDETDVKEKAMELARFMNHHLQES